MEYTISQTFIVDLEALAQTSHFIEFSVGIPGFIKIRFAMGLPSHIFVENPENRILFVDSKIYHCSFLLSNLHISILMYRNTQWWIYDSINKIEFFACFLQRLGRPSAFSYVNQFLNNSGVSAVISLTWLSVLLPLGLLGSEINISENCQNLKNTDL